MNDHELTLGGQQIVTQQHLDAPLQMNDDVWFNLPQPDSSLSLSFNETSLWSRQARPVIGAEG